MRFSEARGHRDGPGEESAGHAEEVETEHQLVLLPLHPGHGEASEVRPRLRWTLVCDIGDWNIHYHEIACQRLRGLIILTRSK